jgi:RimJ/RimL family protein N-acetyltransferase
LAAGLSVSPRASAKVALNLSRRTEGAFVKLREHKIVLPGERVFLRPLTEDDWGLLLRWNSDPRLLYFAEGDNVSSYSLDELQGIYRGVSQTAFCFVIEVEGVPIGECWLQQMNLERVLERYPKADCQRIDLMIGEKEVWGRGIGTEVIQLLSAFAFDQQDADLVFGCDVADYNQASLKAFQKAGYVVDAEIEQPVGQKARYCCDLVLAREEYVATGTASA